jgi:hypothetical protein
MAARRAPAEVPSSDLHQKPVLTESDTTKFLGDITLRQLREWRWKRIGPPFVAFGRMICYRRDAVLAWLERRETKTTAER